ncbi:MAG: TerB N-terminal domain-containing protein, partial [Planctomycetes bacterium]|nr:TerB N-terminal domain-containing protein [Planctomycetota bacterium]
MELSELTAYASEKYHIEEQHKWAGIHGFPGFSVLCHPQTGKWLALLMRQWDAETGTEVERCDLKCGSDSLARWAKPYLSAPVRMRGSQWIDIAFDAGTEKEVVFQLFDQAVSGEAAPGFTFVLERRRPARPSVYQETAIPFAGSRYQAPQTRLPERLRAMRHLFTYGRETNATRARNFYKQAKFMKDYEDDCPPEDWPRQGDFVCYYPTYQDLTAEQLRGYFAWRARGRRGDWQPIATSAAYLYVYELLNGVGADSPGDALERLQAFIAGFIDSGVGEGSMRANVRRWALEYAVLQNLPPEKAREFADPKTLAQDAALAVLKDPAAHADGEVWDALRFFSVKNLPKSPVLAQRPEEGKRLFAAVWRAAYNERGRTRATFFADCFGEPQCRPWRPLANAVYHPRGRQGEREYALTPCRSYRCEGGQWQEIAYEKRGFDLGPFHDLLLALDTRLRQHFKTGRYLSELDRHSWAAPYIEKALAAEAQAQAEAAKAKIALDLSGLERIRREAAVTRESLLTDEERGAEAAPAPIPATAPTMAAAPAPIIAAAPSAPKTAAAP